MKKGRVLRKERRGSIDGWLYPARKGGYYLRVLGGVLELGSLGIIMEWNDVNFSKTIF
jgi:hypothetical protein